MSEAAVVREIAPIGVAEHAGEICARHACGPRAIAPFSDGSHRQAGPSPAVFEAGPDGLAHLSGCETGRGRRRCDGRRHQL